MIKYLSLFLLLNTCFASQILRVAVIDTGLDLEDPRFSYLLCDNGTTSSDFTETTLKDKNSHGTHVTGLIKQYAKNSNYCLIIIKFYSEYGTSYLNRSIEYAIEQKASIINISAGGRNFDEIEYNLIKNSPNITYVVAAGNEGLKLDCNKTTNYPTCYKLPNVISVGCLDKYENKCLTSNYGKYVKSWELGQNVYSTFPLKTCDVQTRDCKGMGYISGTSQATAIHTGKLIYQRTH